MHGGLHLLHLRQGFYVLDIGELCSAFPLLCYASIAGKTLDPIILSIMPASLYILVYTMYACAVCAASDNNGAIVKPTLQNEPRCDHPQCFIFGKLNPSTKGRLS